MTILLSSFSLSDPSKFDVFAAPFRLKLSYAPPYRSTYYRESGRNAHPAME